MVRTLALPVLLIAAAVLAAQDPPAVNADRSGLALQGYDPVAFVSASRAVPGLPSIESVHGGVRYRFADPAHRDRFVADPERYLPAYGGFCAVGVAYGGRYPVDIATWRIVDGRLFLNKNAEVAAMFERDRARLIETADRRWPTLQR